MVANRDPLKLEDAVLFLNRDEREVGGSAADIADQDGIAYVELIAPRVALIGQPGVERGLRLFKET